MDKRFEGDLKGYLLHFDKRIGNPENKHGMAQHYLGVADNLDNRIREHQNGQGAKITAFLAEQGIGFQIARVWQNVSRTWERAMKNTKNLPRFCPICQQGE